VGGTTSPSNPERCVTSVNQLLTQFGGATLVPRDDCGSFHSAELALERGILCARRAVDSERSVQLTVNECIDCLYESTFVWLPQAGPFRVLVREHRSGPRSISLDRCADVTTDAEAGLECVNPTTLYACQKGGGRDVGG